MLTEQYSLSLRGLSNRPAGNGISSLKNSIQHSVGDLAGEQGERGERYKNVTFITYPHETKGRVNKVNVVPGYFVGARTRIAKRF
jgi:hypothetical protein